MSISQCWVFGCSARGNLQRSMLVVRCDLLFLPQHEAAWCRGLVSCAVDRFLGSRVGRRLLPSSVAYMRLLDAALAGSGHEVVRRVYGTVAPPRRLRVWSSMPAA
jgi:hypothetical protein